MFHDSRLFLLTLLCSLLCSCEQNKKEESAQGSKIHMPLISEATEKIYTPRNISVIERTCMESGLVDVQKLDSTISVNLKYSTSDNFLCLDVYDDFNKCYLQPDVALKLVNAQKILRKRYPYYFLVVFDAVRPRSVQARMWDTIAVPLAERSKYVSNPKNGSLHNFGAAVDLSIIDENGIELDMGTPYDYFGELAYPREEDRMIKEGKLSHQQLLNRDILRTVMLEAGFLAITTEWWHFNSCLRAEAFEKYQIIE